ncbi:MAG: type II toxin-antitoxin system HigB family toxin [Deltaproteobacteria bacterium]|nr:type II toxin-antitoxin system HigB family toxin [Deltaproteobacteria bacterium]
MQLVGRERLDAFVRKHADTRSWVEAWIAEVTDENTKWKGPQDIKARYASASFLANRVVIFNVKGNSYRLEVQVSFNIGTVVVKWVGTHGEYDKRNAAR